MRNIAIWGASRSGSTIFESFIAHKNDILALGEVKNYFKRGQQLNERCSCGKNAAECTIWSSFSNVDFNDYHSLYRSLQKLGGGYVDSSKSPFYLVKHKRYFHKHFLIIRQPTAVINSYRKNKARPESTGSHTQMRKMIPPMSLTYWCAWNLISLILMPKGTVVFYDEFILTAQGQMYAQDKIHQISGNPSRFEKLRVKADEHKSNNFDKVMKVILKKLATLLGHDVELRL